MITYINNEKENKKILIVEKNFYLKKEKQIKNIRKTLEEILKENDIILPFNDFKVLSSTKDSNFYFFLQ